MPLGAARFMMFTQKITTHPLPSSIYGYFAGGQTSLSAGIAVTDQITFSTSVTAANTVSNLSTNRDFLAGMTDSMNYGYMGGGGYVVPVAITDRITFSTGITAAHTASNLSQARDGLAGVSANSNIQLYGYFAGGYTGDDTGQVVTTDRLTYSTGITAANAVSNLSIARGRITGISDGLSFGYFSGGDTGAQVMVVTVDQITFSSGVTAANTASNLSQARCPSGLTDNSGAYGYWAGGKTDSVTAVATTDRITYSSGITAANTVSNLTLARLGTIPVSGVSGYFAGGNSYSNPTTIIYLVNTDKLDFSTGIPAASAISNLTLARTWGAGISDSVP